MTLPVPDDYPLPVGVAEDADAALAARHRPVLMLDAAEPAPPLVLGYTLMRAAGPSPSSKFLIHPQSGGLVIEYAIWHDWDIQHLYDLEHVWVHIDASGAVCRVEGSMHGLRVAMDRGSGLPDMLGERPVVYVEPGKHAIWSCARAMTFMARANIMRMCGADAGQEGVHLGNRFAEHGAYEARALDHRLARLAMKRAAFTPTFSFSAGETEPVLVPWGELERWIGGRMRALIAALPAKVPHLAAIFLDCGDTLIDETTEEREAGDEIVQRAEEIPDAMDAVRALSVAGHRLALVADGPRGTFENLLKPRGIWALMETHAISGDVGALKPSPAMFAAAMAGMGLDDDARARIVMAGNNLARDIRGANEFGLISLFVGWSKKRSHEPAGAAEVPDFSITRLDQLVPMIEAIEVALEDREVDHD
ncbi:HAD family hydrolase [Martelella sp. HB161492]|uniref:HAD family hydrolase n=1 Tax=Martelella sp. HB161492 TaxID=2720726 RepID=UPI00158FFE06|nr:HAD family hydrolase [Martelella sp. HB161492]